MPVHGDTAGNQRLRPGAAMELRKGKRFNLAAPAFFCWERSDGTLQDNQGTTRDISSRGVFVICSSSPPLGAHVELEVYLPARNGMPRAVQLHGEGEVLRVDRDGDRAKGFAAEVIFQTENSNGMTVLNPEIQ